jgi:hypothetical protein
LPQSLHGQPKHIILDLGVQHAPHNISLARPEMKKTLIVFTGDRILGRGQVESDYAFFHDDGLIRPC